MTRPTDRRDDAAWLDEMLDEMAGSDVPAPAPDLMARVLADAVAQMPPPGGAPASAPLWRQIVRGLGGWSAVGGLVAAAATGFVVGLGGLETVGADALWSDTYYDSSTALDAFGWDYEEG